MSLNAKDVLALSRKHTDDSIAGTSGVLAGKNAQIASIEEITVDGKKGKRVTFTWYKDGETVARTNHMDVMDGDQGIQGIQGEPGPEGFSPTIEVYEASDQTYRLKITTSTSTIITPNLKTKGGGIDVRVNRDSLVFTY